jgi:hypothetical protein
MKCLLRATTALNRAAAGCQSEAQLARAREAILDCETAIILAAKALGEDIVALATRRIDQLMAGFEQLESLDVPKWLDAKLPPLTTSKKDRKLTATLRQITAVVAAALKSKKDPVIVGADSEQPPATSTG